MATMHWKGLRQLVNGRPAVAAKAVLAPAKGRKDVGRVAMTNVLDFSPLATDLKQDRRRCAGQVER
jgi:hypothetical protein